MKEYIIFSIRIWYNIVNYKHMGEEEEILRDTFRCMIKDEKSNYYIGQDYNGKKYKILKNEHIRCKVGDDLYFYAVKEAGILRDKLTPISDEMAGVIHRTCT